MRGSDIRNPCGATAERNGRNINQCEPSRHEPEGRCLANANRRTGLAAIDDEVERPGGDGAILGETARKGEWKNRPIRF